MASLPSRRTLRMVVERILGDLLTEPPSNKYSRYERPAFGQAPFKVVNPLTFLRGLRNTLQGGMRMMARLALLSTLVLRPLAAPAMAADVTGKWRVTISIPGSEITGKASLKQTGDKVTGWVGPSEDDPIPVTGTLAGKKLTLKTLPQPGRTVAFDKCE